MQDFEISEKDVILVDSNNISQIDPEIEFPDKVGIDEERGGGTHVFDPSNTSIIQVFNGKRVFIFDVQELGHNPQLKEIITHILVKCHIFGQEIGKEMS